MMQQYTNPNGVTARGAQQVSAALLPDLSRRRFIQAAGAASAVSLLPMWLAEAAEAATPIGPTDGILVLLTLSGGNDGLNTFVPITNGTYYDKRPNIAIRPEHALPLTADRGLHPQLPYMKSLWDQGRVAVVDGVGQPGGGLSHFVSSGRMMSATADGKWGPTGWLGRVLDGLPRTPLTGLSIGATVPLVLAGHAARANAVPADGGHVKRIERTDASHEIQYQSMMSMRGVSTGLGPLADRATTGIGASIELASEVAPFIPNDTDDPELVEKMRLAASLINANVGIRVMSIVFSGFDHHANQLEAQQELFVELNAALETFFTSLHPTFAERTLLVGTSEFGRRVASNATGSDHGTANAMFAIGSAVKGGFYGQQPSLTDLDPQGNLKHTVDYRHFYSNIVTNWMRADSAAVLGGNYSDLGFLRTPTGATPSAPFPNAPTTPPANPATPATPGATPRRGKRAELARLYIAYFGRAPDDDGLEYWAELRSSGRNLSQISTDFASSHEFVARYGSLNNPQFVDLVYRNVLGRSPDAQGRNHWISMLNGGGTRGSIMINFSESAEFQQKTASMVYEVDATGPVGRLYRAYFGRQPDQDGLAFWIDSGLDPSVISQEFASSREFRANYGALDNAGFVRLIYQNVLGRQPDSAGMAHWTNILNRGTSRGEVMLNFSDSDEFIRKVKG